MVAIDWVRLKAEIVEATVVAVNATLYLGEERALQDVPVRKVYRGGRQTVRFKTAAEIEKDKDLRSRLGLAPELLATPEAIARVRAAGRNPLKSLRTSQGEFGFARTIERPSSDPRVNKAGQTRSDRGLTENRRNRANDFMPGGNDLRVVNPKDERRLADEPVERRLSGRGRYELRSGRAVFQRSREVATVDIRKGEVQVRETTFVPVGPARLGGGLRSTIRVEKAHPDQFPVIEGHLVAGDAEHDYAIHQELGNRHNPAHPFLRPRLPEWREELPEQLRRSLGRLGR